MPEMNLAENVSETPRIIRLSFGMEEANTYFLVSEGHAVLIDVCSKNVIKELIRRSLIPTHVILTHEHADHIWGLNALRREYPDVKVIAQANCSRAIGDPKANKAAQYRIYAILRFGDSYDDAEARDRTYRCAPAEVTFEQKYVLQWKNWLIKLIYTPGHSPGSCLAIVNEDLVFSGDTILNEKTFLSFEGGDCQRFAEATLPVIQSIRSEARILPGHGKPFEKTEWMK